MNTRTFTTAHRRLFLFLTFAVVSGCSRDPRESAPAGTAAAASLALVNGREWTSDARRPDGKTVFQ